MATIDFADSSLGDYFAARRHLIAAGLRGGYPLGNTLCCRLDYDANGECFCDHVNEGTQDR